jgi:hypothetical protein
MAAVKQIDHRASDVRTEVVRNLISKVLPGYPASVSGVRPLLQISQVR